jgi:hypothetical protein
VRFLALIFVFVIVICYSFSMCTLGIVHEFVVHIFTSVDAIYKTYVYINNKCNTLRNTRFVAK